MSKAVTHRDLERFAKRTQKQIELAQKALEKPLPKGLVPMHTILTDGMDGNAELQIYELSQFEAAKYNLAQAVGSTPEMVIQPGKYVRLLVDRDLMMTDAPHEAHSNRDIIDGAKGNVLIAGLGLGMILIPILLKQKVKTVTVIEKSQGVINLVGPRMLAWREHQGVIGAKPAPLIIVHGDAETWEPPLPLKWDIIYLDIWPTIDTRNLPQIARLKRKYRKYLSPGGWLGVWVEKVIQKRRRYENKLIKQAKEFRAYINDAKTPEERAKRKSVLFGVMYGDPKTKIHRQAKAAMEKVIRRGKKR
jgi:hypothetical protein